MAGGEGTRLRPLTSNAPEADAAGGQPPDDGAHHRPAAPARLRRDRRHRGVHGQRHQDLLRRRLASSASRSIYADEPVPLGTAGSVRNAMEHLDERFLVISGDVITDIDLTKLVAFHDQQEAVATIGLIRVENPLEFGIVITREDGTIERFLEKPTWGQVFSDTINTGIYVLDPEIFDYIDAGPAGRLLERGVPGAAGRRRAAVRRHRRGLLGGRRHPRGLPAGPPGRPRPAGAARHPRLPDQRRRVAGRGRRDLARGRSSSGRR